MATPAKNPPVAAKAPPPPPFAPPAPPATSTAAVSMFEIEDGIEPPAKRIGIKGESIYPFEKINIGQSFFVPASEKMPEPWKTITSLASRKTRELFPKAFTSGHMVKKMADGTEVDGVRVFRIADNTEPLPAPIPRKKKGDAAPAVVEAEAS